MDIQGYLDRTDPDMPKDRAEFNLEQLPVQDLKLLKRKEFNLSMDKATIQTASGHFLIEEDNLNAEVEAIFDSADFRLKSDKTDNLLISALTDVLGDISTFDLNAKVNGKIRSPNIQISSDIDQTLASSLKNAVRKQRAKFEQQLESAISKRTKGVVGDSQAEISGLNNLKEKLDERLDMASSVMPN